MKSIFLFFLITGLLFSSNGAVKGRVIDNNGIPLSGVNVVIKGTTSGASTDDAGYYFISNLKPGLYSIEFSHIGYKTKTLVNVEIFNEDKNINIQLIQDVIESEQIVITAGKHEQKISDLTVSTAVIPSEEFSERNFISLSDALKYTGGVNMTYDQVSIRGSSGYSRGVGTRVLTAIDGIPYYTGDTGEIVWEIVPVTELDKVEIIKGASSSLYGSSALGGVINVITRKIPASPFTYIKTYYGIWDKPSFSAWDWSSRLRVNNGLTLTHSQRFGDVGISASFSRLEDDSYKQGGFYKRYLGYLKSEWDISQASSITLLYNSINQRNGNFIYWKDSRNALVPPDADLGERIETDRYMSGLIYKNDITNTLKIEGRGSIYNTFWKDETTSRNNSSTNLIRGEVLLSKQFENNLILISGVEGTTSKVNSNIFGNPDAFSIAGYSQLDYKFDIPLNISAGVRYDFNKLDTIKGYHAFSPKFGLNYSVNKELVLRSSIGTGFRAPSLAEAFTSTTASGITVKPNPGLTPEKNLSFEAGANYQVNKLWNIDAAIFQNEFYDYIEADVDPKDGLIIFSNITRARIQGSELNTTIKFFSGLIILNINYTYLWSRDLVTNKALKYRPRNLCYANLTYMWSSLELGAAFRYWSRVEEIDNELSGIIRDSDTRVDVKVLDLNAGYNLINSGVPVSIHLNAYNILNYNYVELIGNLAPIRNYSLSMELFF